MLGTHGSASATGARTAVVRVSVRRVLLLVALLAGALCALWIADAHSAQAQEHPGGSVDVLSVIEDPGDTAEPLPLRESISDPVIGVKERVARMTADTSEVVATSVSDTDALVVRSNLGRQVRETVHGTSSPEPESRLGAEPTARGVVERTSAGETPGTDDEQPAEPELGPEVDDGDTDAPSHTVPPQLIDEAAEHGPTEHESAVPASSGLVSGASGGSTGTAITGGAIAGYLTSLKALAPTSGVLDAGRHALRSTPVDTADEPAFLPD